jgi:hypothetical protein
MQKIEEEKVNAWKFPKLHEGKDTSGQTDRHADV